MTTSTSAAMSFKVRVAQLHAQNPDKYVPEKAIAALVQAIEEITEDTPGLANCIYNDALSSIDPYWRVTTK